MKLKCILCVLLGSLFFSLMAQSKDLEKCSLKTSSKNCSNAQQAKKTELLIKSAGIKVKGSKKSSQVVKAVPSASVLKKTTQKTVVKKKSVKDVKWIAKLDQAYTQVKTMQADFEQSYSSGINEKKASGKMYISRPGKMKWEYKDPKGKFFLADGTSLSLYDPNFKQVMQSKQMSADQAPIGLALLFGQQKASSLFHVTVIKNTPSQISYKLLPKEPVPNIQEVQMTLKKGSTYSIEETKVIDAFGGENSMRFNKVKNNQKLASDIFKFKAPKGASVVKTEAITF